MNDLIRHRWQQIDTLFGQALEQRRSFLLEICGTDTDLQAHVEKLLQLHDECWTSSLQDVVKRAQGEVVPTRDDRNIRNCNEFEGSGI